VATSTDAATPARRFKRAGPSGGGCAPGHEQGSQPDEQPALAREQAEALHEEIGRLPGSFRLPVVLCYFEGLTLDEAARRLRWPAGTVRSRLARARDKPGRRFAGSRDHFSVNSINFSGSHRR